MGTPDGDGFRSNQNTKRVDKEKWKRIIQPDGDSDSSLDWEQEALHDNAGNACSTASASSLLVSGETSSARLSRLSQLYSRGRGGVGSSNMAPQEPRPGPSSSVPNALSRATVGPLARPGASSSTPPHPPGTFNINPSVTVGPSPDCLRRTRLMRFLRDETPQNLSQSAAASTSGAAGSAANSVPGPSDGPPTALGGTSAFMGGKVVSGKLRRRVHFLDNYENRLRLRHSVYIRNSQAMQAMRDNINSASTPKGPPDAFRGTRNPPVLSSSIASLRSMMHCGNNPDWLKLSDQVCGPSQRPVRWTPPRPLVLPAARRALGSWQNAGPEQAPPLNLQPEPPAEDRGNENVGPPVSPPGVQPAEPMDMQDMAEEVPEPPAAAVVVVAAMPDEEQAPDAIVEPEQNEEAAPQMDNAEAQPAENNIEEEEDDQANQPSLPDAGLNTSILSMLECPVCLEYMGPPIHQCKRGHLVCNNCRGQLLMCPTCRCRFTDLRNLALEKIAEMLNFPCKNEECGQSFKLRNKDEHELNCPWRMYNCVAQHCQWQGLHQNLLTHTQEQHTDLIMRGDSHFLEMPLDINFNRNYLFVCWGELFCANMRHTPDVNGIYFLVNYIGPVGRAEEYVFTVKLEREGAVNCLTYRRLMHRDNIKLTTVYNNGDGFYVSLDQAKHFTNDARRARLLVQFERVNAVVE